MYDVMLFSDAMLPGIHNVIYVLDYEIPKKLEYTVQSSTSTRVLIL